LEDKDRDGRMMGDWNWLSIMSSGIVTS